MSHREASQKFQNLVSQLPDMGKEYHSQVLLQHARDNRPFVKKVIRDIPTLAEHKRRSCIIVSAGPSVRRKNSIRRILESKYTGTIIAADGAYIACLQGGLFPDFVVTVDPDPTRIVRWFGDPDIEKHTVNDDYFARQDIDVTFRDNMFEQNKKNIDLVNQSAPQTKAIVCTVTHHHTVVKRLMEAKFDMYWWNPLVDDVKKRGSLTQQLFEINRVPCLNTGGTVGTAAWVFAGCTLKIPNIAVVGMDYGYYADTPIQQTQRYYETIKYAHQESADLSEFFVPYTFPLTGEEFYTDATYYWYRKNFLELVEKANVTTFNCTEGGTLIDDRIRSVHLEQFLSDFS